MARGWTRRRRLVARAAAFAALIALAALGLVLLRPAPRPYVPGEKLEGLSESLSRRLPPDYPRVHFADASAEAGIEFRHFHGVRSGQLPEDMGSGAAWGDFDNDGFLDLFAVNEAGPLTLSPEEIAASPAHNALYHNRGEGSFEEVARQAGVDHRGCGQAAAWGDFDNDGFLDLVATNYGANLLYHNQGDGSFENVSPAAGLSGVEGFWSGASWADYDGDGDLDLYICGYVQYRYDAAQARVQTRQYNVLIPAALNPSAYKPERNLFYRNEGDGTFSEVARAAGVDNPTGRSLSAAWCDFDADGRVDLYVANDLSDNALFRNLGRGAFEDISHGAWVADYRGSMGLAVGDWDADGDQDLFITHWIAQENAFYSNVSADYRAAGLPPGSPALRFMDVADQVGLGQIALDYVGWGTAFVDYDNDGRPDLLVANGSTFQREDDPHLLVPMRLQLFWNRGPQQGFFEVGAVSGAVFARPLVGRGLAVGDYDNDGDADAFVVVNGGRGLLLRNEGERSNHWLKVRLQDAAGRRVDYGARLRVVAGERVQVRQLGSSPSYYSQHAAGEELFGLGKAARVDTLEVLWPQGRRQRLAAVAADQTLVVKEPLGREERAAGSAP